MRPKSWPSRPAASMSRVRAILSWLAMRGTVNPALAGPARVSPHGHACLPTQAVATGARGGVASVLGRPYERQIQDYTIISGTPKTVLPEDPARPGVRPAWQYFLLGR